MPAHRSRLPVYSIFANLEIKFSDLDFLELEFSTRSRILDTVDSPNSFVVRIFNRPVMLIHPLMTSSPTLASRGTLSPVRALVFSVVFPSSITPSIGIFSPGCTTMIVPTSTSSGSTCSSFPSYLDICIIRADIHQFADVPAALSNSIALEQFADLVKQHNR